MSHLDVFIAVSLCSTLIFSCGLCAGRDVERSKQAKRESKKFPLPQRGFLKRL